MPSEAGGSQAMSNKQGTEEIDVVIFDDSRTSHRATYSASFNCFFPSEIAGHHEPISFIKSFGRTKGSLDQIYVILDGEESERLEEDRVKDKCVPWIEWLEAVHRDTYLTVCQQRRKEEEKQGLKNESQEEEDKEEEEEAAVDTTYDSRHKVPSELPTPQGHATSEQQSSGSSQKEDSSEECAELRARAVVFTQTRPRFADFFLREFQFLLDGKIAKMRPSVFGNLKGSNAVFQEEIYIYTGHTDDEKYVQEGSKDTMLWIDWLREVDPTAYNMKKKLANGQRTNNAKPNFQRRLKRTWTGYFKSLSQCNLENYDFDNEVESAQPAQKRGSAFGMDKNPIKKPKHAPGLPDVPDDPDAYTGKLTELLAENKACKSANQEAKEKADITEADWKEKQKLADEARQKMREASAALSLAKSALEDNKLKLARVWSAM